jgi:hypothetical protein
VDFFDKPATCYQVLDRLLSGMVFDALEAAHTDLAQLLWPTTPRRSEAEQ